MNYLTRTMVVVAITFGFSSAVTAASVNIPDSTFDGTTSELGNGGWTPSNGAPLSWSVTPSDGSQSGIYNPIDYEYFPADIDNITNVGYANNGYLSQTLPEALTASIIYTLTVDVGNTSGHSFPGFKIRHGSKTGHLSEHWAGEILPENA